MFISVGVLMRLLLLIDCVVDVVVVVVRKHSRCPRGR